VTKHQKCLEVCQSIFVIIAMKKTHSTGQEVCHHMFVSEENNSSSSYDNVGEKDKNVKDDNDEEN